MQVATNRSFELHAAFRSLDHYTNRERETLKRRQRGPRWTQYAVKRTLKRIERKILWLRDLSQGNREVDVAQFREHIQELLGLLVNVASLASFTPDGFSTILDGWPNHPGDPASFDAKYPKYVRSLGFERAATALLVHVREALRRLEPGYAGQVSTVHTVEPIAKLHIVLREVGSYMRYCPDEYFSVCIEKAKEAQRRKLSERRRGP